MTILDQIHARSRAIVQSIIDKEPVNYFEAGALYSIVAYGRHNASVLSVLYNHAQDYELKALIKEAIDGLAVTIKQCEEFLAVGGAQIPTTRFSHHPLEDRLDIPSAARLTDMEISQSLHTMSATSQTALLISIHQCYQLEISVALRSMLNDSLDWNYRLLQLTLHQGWLPEIAKVEH